MERPPSQGSTHTETSLPDSLFSKLSETGTHITESPRTSTEALGRDSFSKDESSAIIPDISLSPASGRVRELRHPPALPLHLGDTLA